MLQALGRADGFAVDVVPPVKDPVAGIVSSSRDSHRDRARRPDARATDAGPALHAERGGGARGAEGADHRGADREPSGAASQGAAARRRVRGAGGVAGRHERRNAEPGATADGRRPDADASKRTCSTSMAISTARGCGSSGWSGSGTSGGSIRSTRCKPSSRRCSRRGARRRWTSSAKGKDAKCDNARQQLAASS